MAHVRVIELAVLDRVQGHGLGGALDREVAGHPVLVSPDVLDPGALEGHRRVLVDLQERRGPQVLVALLVVGADARGVDGRLDPGLLRVLRVDGAAGDDLGEVAAHGHHAQVLGRELNLCVKRIELPRHLRKPPCR